MAKLTTHVLDTANGRPGDGIAVELFGVDVDRTLISSALTNSDGRTDEPLLAGDDFTLGTYEIVFNVGDYFSALNATASTPPFLGSVVIRFTISEHKNYHVPLLVSPWSYSTYRGS